MTEIDEINAKIKALEERCSKLEQLFDLDQRLALQELLTPFLLAASAKADAGLRHPVLAKLREIEQSDAAPQVVSATRFYIAALEAADKALHRADVASAPTAQ
jgi:hypothetical protein